MKFLDRIITELRTQNADLSAFDIVLPGKRPIVFIKEILKGKNYSGFLPAFFTIEDLIQEISGKQAANTISLWLVGFEVYREIEPVENFAQFLKWFPTLLKDWDDMLKFSQSDNAVLEYMFEEERIKNWAENLGDSQTSPRRRFLNFWQKMSVFLPLLKQKLAAENMATAGMIHEAAKSRLTDFAQTTDRRFVFCGFNAFTPVEQELVRNLLQWDKAQCFFQADSYYFHDERQEAGKFLREYKNWKEFNESRVFQWIDDDFSQPKDIKVYEVSGNVTQTKVLPEILHAIPDKNFSNTAVILLDENLLPASLDSLATVEDLNITMGFPLKNLGFSNAMKKLFYLQKQLEKNPSSYYYNDVLSIVEELPNNSQDLQIITGFKIKIEQRNIVYIKTNLLEEYLADLSYLKLLQKTTALDFLEMLIDFCYRLKFRDLDDILYENISHFEKSFKIIKAQISPYNFPIKMETLEVLISQLINSEAIDFQGEPVRGLQVMGLLETRLLNFENVIVLSANEGKLPLGNSQNTYLPFGVRQHFELHTYLENDSIYAYHFYRLLQNAKNIHLLFNALGSGINTGEKSRFITQLEVEDKHHKIENIIIENSSHPIRQNLIRIEKTPKVLEQLEAWKTRVSASHLNNYINNPLDFYLSKVLNTRESDQMEEELSRRSYGQLVHYALQFIYEKFIGKTLSTTDLELSNEAIAEALSFAIDKLQHQLEFYERGMNFIHKSIAERVVRSVLNYDRKLISDGNMLEIISVEKKFENVDFYMNDERSDKVSFYGYIDRVDRLNGDLRIIDYKTGNIKPLSFLKAKKPEDEEKLERYFFDDKKNQQLQLSIYGYAALNDPTLPDNFVKCGIWSFAQLNKGVTNLCIGGDDEISRQSLEKPMIAIKNVIAEILDPAVVFEEKEKIVLPQQ